MRTLRLILLIVAAGLAWSAMAQSPAIDVVRETADRVIERLNTSGELSDNQAYALVEELIIPHLDFEAFARLTLGKHWRTASPEQRRAFTEGFQSLLMRTYATSLNTYAGEHFEYLNQRDEGEGRVLVQTELIRAQKPPVRVDYRLREREGAWKIYDVVIEGVSLIINYRSNFNEEVSRRGLETLIAQLQAGTIELQRPRPSTGAD